MTSDHGLTGRTTQGPVLTRGGEAETCADPSAVMALFADSAQTGGAFTSYRSAFAEGAPGAPAHVHTRAWEVFFVLGGSLQVLLGEEVTLLHQGDFLAVPPGTPHAFRAAPGSGADVLCVFTPGMDRFDYLRLLGRVTRGEEPPSRLAETSERFDNHYVDSPVWRATLEAPQ
ncbi:cupin domain-containing protein [Streptacidiphilus sp. ASG 303]|uniref:cupin domain-containing protein n=1 Tax=Streptacidiphilus sp. ASG 303 TaxID=2896847 RepID=UPI001E614A37|nr:cupin domain-containing protein [Streptacidiphilus sp. ASG 303]MCD0484869.1 cupin domain-containing protein [Streptacidiphilus sp. ASG 303]